VCAREIVLVVRVVVCFFPFFCLFYLAFLLGVPPVQQGRARETKKISVGFGRNIMCEINEHLFLKRRINK
jgi:hypothetical protein